MRKNSNWRSLWVAPALAFALMLLGPTVASAIPMVGLTLDNKLVRFDSDTPETIISTVQISLPPGVVLIGIDYHPGADLYGVSNTRRIYLLNEDTGSALALNNTPFNPALNGTVFGLDFNPVEGPLRIVSEKDQSLRINLNGTLAGVDTPLSYAVGDPNEGVDPNVSAVAYTNNVGGANQTTLYGIDHSLNVLVRIGGPNSNPSPNTGVLTTIGPLGVAAGKFNGFEIEPGTNTAYAAFRGVGGISRLYTINLNSGQATLVGTITGSPLRGLAINTLIGAVAIAVSADNDIFYFDPDRPGAPFDKKPITGLQPGETILGIDSRPGQFHPHALGSTNRLYIIDANTGVATEVGSGPFNPALSGTSFGFDFNPVADRIRVVSDADQSLRLNPDDGTVVGVDTPLAYAAGDPNAGANPNVVGAAYTNDFFGATTTTLYGIDSNLDILVRQGGVDGNPSPNGGKLTTIGKLGVNASSIVAFDILSDPNDPRRAAYAVLSGANNISRLFLINLATGKATQIGVIGGNELVVGISVVFD